MPRTLQQLLRGGSRSLRITQCSLQLLAPCAALQPWALRLRALLCRPDSGTGRCEQSLYSTIIFCHHATVLHEIAPRCSWICGGIGCRQTCLLARKRGGSPRWPTWAPDFMWVMVGGRASAMATCCRSNASRRPCTTNTALKSYHLCAIMSLPLSIRSLSCLSSTSSSRRRRRARTEPCRYLHRWMGRCAHAACRSCSHAGLSVVFHGHMQEGSGHLDEDE